MWIGQREEDIMVCLSTIANSAAGSWTRSVIANARTRPVIVNVWTRRGYKILRLRNAERFDWRSFREKLIAGGRTNMPLPPRYPPVSKYMLMPDGSNIEFIAYHYSLSDQQIAQIPPLLWQSCNTCHIWEPMIRVWVPEKQYWMHLNRPHRGCTARNHHGVLVPGSFVVQRSTEPYFALRYAVPEGVPSLSSHTKQVPLEDLSQMNISRHEGVHVRALYRENPPAIKLPMINDVEAKRIRNIICTYKEKVSKKLHAFARPRTSAYFHSLFPPAVLEDDYRLLYGEPVRGNLEYDIYKVTGPKFARDMKKFKITR